MFWHIFFSLQCIGGNKSYTILHNYFFILTIIIRPVCFTIKWFHICKDRALVGWPAQQIWLCADRVNLFKWRDWDGVGPLSPSLEKWDFSRLKKCKADMLHGDSSTSSIPHHHSLVTTAASTEQSLYYDTTSCGMWKWTRCNGLVGSAWSDPQNHGGCFWTNDVWGMRS